jgi:hypothetical protein
MGPAFLIFGDERHRSTCYLYSSKSPSAVNAFRSSSVRSWSIDRHGVPQQEGRVLTSIAVSAGAPVTSFFVSVASR